MRTGILHFNGSSWEGGLSDPADRVSCSVILVFANRFLLQEFPNPYLGELRKHYPNASIVSASSGGEICKGNSKENSLSAAALVFDKTKVKVTCRNASEANDEACRLGMMLAQDLSSEDLRSVMVFADGYHVNGDDLISGLSKELPDGVQITGGLAGDDQRFEMTLVGLNENVKEANAVAIGFYGDHFNVNIGINRGWDLFGPERTITRSDKHILYEIDHTNALDLYKKYLGKYSEELPGSALMFPLCIIAPDGVSSLVRTVLGVDDKAGTMTFAGNMPEGAKVRFMKANFDRLILGTEEVEGQLLRSGYTSSQFSLVVSCIGRKIVLSARIDEELDAIADIIKDSTNMLGYFSYGEFGPGVNNSKSYLHNQTTVVTTLSED